MRTVNTKFTNHKNARARKDCKEPNTVSAKSPTPSMRTSAGNWSRHRCRRDCQVLRRSLHREMSPLINSQRAQCQMRSLPLSHVLGASPLLPSSFLNTYSAPVIRQQLFQTGETQRRTRQRVPFSEEITTWLEKTGCRTARHGACTKQDQEIEAFPTSQRINDARPILAHWLEGEKQTHTQIKTTHFLKVVNQNHVHVGLTISYYQSYVKRWTKMILFLIHLTVYNVRDGRLPE